MFYKTIEFGRNLALDGEFGRSIWRAATRELGWLPTPNFLSRNSLPYNTPLSTPNQRARRHPSLSCLQLFLYTSSALHSAYSSFCHLINRAPVHEDSICIHIATPSFATCCCVHGGLDMRTSATNRAKLHPQTSLPWPANPHG